MTIPQIEIKRGIKFEFTLDFSAYGPLPPGVSWKAALVNPSTNIRYEANNGTPESGHVTFTWPSGLNAQGTINTTSINGTARMDVGTYNLEVYRSDYADMGTLYERFRVVDSSLLADSVTTQTT